MLLRSLYNAESYQISFLQISQFSALFWPFQLLMPKMYSNMGLNSGKSLRLSDDFVLSKWPIRLLDRKFCRLYVFVQHLIILVSDNIFTFVPKHASPNQLVWTLLLLKCYHTEEFSSILMKMDEKAFGKLVWMMIVVISKNSIVSCLIG